MDIQKRSESFVVRTAIIFAVCYACKEFFNIEIENQFVEALIVIGYALYNIFAAANNPTSKNKF